MVRAKLSACDGDAIGSDEGLAGCFCQPKLADFPSKSQSPLILGKGRDEYRNRLTERKMQHKPQPTTIDSRLSERNQGYDLVRSLCQAARHQHLDTTGALSSAAYPKEVN